MPPSVIADLLMDKTGAGSDTFLSKTIFNINKKCRDLIDIAQGINTSWTGTEMIINK
jgi:hypothetical protein